MPLRPDVLLRLESLLALAVTLWLYHTQCPHHWLFFLAMVLVPDLSLLLYAAGPLRLAAACYNLAHSLALPLVVGLLGLLLGKQLPVQLALTWAAHIFLDRACGYGLKFPEAFQPTHIQSAASFPR